MNRDEFYTAVYDYKQSHLKHYGIHGMRWGVRRFQNEDGSLTAAGKLRYSRVDKLASAIHKKAKALEPKLTADVSKAVSDAGASMYGLENRLKTHGSIARKIDTDSLEKDLPIESAARGIKDANRYTSLADDSNFVSSYNKVKSSLESQGYTEVKCKNYFDLYRQGLAKHKQITSVFQDKNGNQFEIQFQTPSSIKAKELKTPLYEEVRNPKTSDARRAELEGLMDSLAMTVTDPKGVYSIKTH